MRALHRHKRSLRRLEQKVAAWNAANPIGTAVKYRTDLGKIKETVTRSAAWVTSGPVAVIMLEDRSGYYDFERILPTPAAVR
jgi:adenylosuccinate lyase